ncbi:MAG: hypothetical protein Q8S73_36955 [Deltaproteobacteria bacterium]|nr:hypothetical protein [Myxococcales bacterium]MDP3219750.1 hypothetical protein [Deltaproteobacteria bacterium]
MRLSALQWFLGGCAVALALIVGALVTSPRQSPPAPTPRTAAAAPPVPSIEPALAPSTPPAPAPEPDWQRLFNAYVASRFRGGDAVITGIYLNLRGVPCTRRNLTRIGTMSDAPAALEMALRSPVEFVQCTPEDDGDAITQRWPSPGVRIPPSIEWQRRYVVTPANARTEPDAVWCLHDGRAGLPGALCFRRAADCRERERGLVELYDRLNPDLGTNARTIYPCRLTLTLWCFPTRGSQQQCTVDEDACEEWRDDAGDPRGRCEERNAL